jgi:hypothetical protein
VAFAVFSLNFGAYRVFGDGEDYYSFVQRLFGDRASGSGYNFGVGLLNAPFYAAGRAVRALVGAGSVATHVLPASITIASIAYALVAMAAVSYLLGRLGLGGRGFVVAAATFGSPLWYYASFSPSYTHAADAAVFSVATLAAYRALTDDARWFVAFGALLGLAVAVRPFNAGVVAGGVAALFGLRRARPALVTGGVAVATFLVLALIPLALGTGLRTRASGEEVASGDAVFGFAPATPFKMLFSDHRGLFVWTPVTFLGVVGIVLVLRQRHNHPFLIVLCAMSAALLAMHVSLLWWDGGWSYSMRYLASPLPLYAIGLGALLDAAGPRRNAVVLVTVACVAWSLLLGMNHAFGASQSDGALEVAAKRSPSAFVHLVWSYSRARHVVERLG